MIKDFEDIEAKLAVNNIPVSDIEEIKKYVNDVKGELIKRKTLLSQIIGHPTVLVAILTAVVGPFTLAYLSNENEKSKLRLTILDKVMTITNGTNFDDPNEMLRVGVIASIVNENEDKFGLNLKESEARFKSIAENLKVISIKSLKEKVDRLHYEKKDLSDTIEIKESEVKELSGRMKIVKNELSRLDRSSSVNIKKIRDLEREKTYIEKETLKLKNEMVKASQEKTLLQQDLATAKKILDDKNERIIRLAKESEERLKELEKKRAEVTDANTSLEELKKTLSEELLESEKREKEFSSLEDRLASESKELKESKATIEMLKREIIQLKLKSESNK